jgi:tRNA-2-methylthio-N6-dimethylallyladenosine synthase
VKGERLAEIQAAILDEQARFNAAGAGRVTPVLFDRAGRKPGQLHGRSPHMQSVHVDAPAALLGQIAPVYIEAARPLSLSGRLADSCQPTVGQVAESGSGRRGMAA